MKLAAPTVAADSPKGACQDSAGPRPSLATLITRGGLAHMGRDAHGLLDEPGPLRSRRPLGRPGAMAQMNRAFRSCHPCRALSVQRGAGWLG
eukprot:5259971-Pyramimonas_sp.AAC.1